MAKFLGEIPKHTRYPIRVGTEAYLPDPVFDIPKKHRVGLLFFHWTWLLARRNQSAEVKKELFTSGKELVIRLMTPLRMSYEESYAKAFPFDKTVSGMLAPEMIEDTARIMNKATKDKSRVSLIINNRAAANAPLIAQKIADKIHFLPIELAEHLDEGREGDCKSRKQSGSGVGAFFREGQFLIS